MNNLIKIDCKNLKPVQTGIAKNQDLELHDPNHIMEKDFVQFYTVKVNSIGGYNYIKVGLLKLYPFWSSLFNDWLWEHLDVKNRRWGIHFRVNNGMPFIYPRRNRMLGSDHVGEVIWLSAYEGGENGLGSERQTEA